MYLFIHWDISPQQYGLNSISTIRGNDYYIWMKHYKDCALMGCAQAGQDNLNC